MFGEYEDTHQKANFPDGEMLQGGDGDVLENLVFPGCVILGRMLGLSGPSSPPL